MRMSQALIPTLKESPAEAEIISHKLMIRAGLTRMLSSGLYSWLPLGYKVLRKVEDIVREEMDRAGGQEVLLPILSPQELWQQSGRWDLYGPELMRVRDRHDRIFGLGPTHEEVITDLARREIGSYRQLPIILYQIQTKFRDEIRPRFGVMRAREFRMKDAYSFDKDSEGLEKSYQKMYQAYCRIFTRCGLDCRAVEADTGPIGGEISHEFMVLSDSGEDEVVYCDGCGYAANINRAEYAKGRNQREEVRIQTKPLKKVKTPGMKTIEEVTTFLKCKPENLVKTLIYGIDGRPVVILIRGDHQINESRLADLLCARNLALADEDLIYKVTGAPLGFAGPVGLKGIEIIADSAVAEMSNFISGANQPDMHMLNINIDRDFKTDRVADIRRVIPRDRCPKCERELSFTRGIEVGHVFKLGTKYSQRLGATFSDSKGHRRPALMGCYGIGIDRLIAAIIEKHHDSEGIVWPLAVAPYQVSIIVVNSDDSRQADLGEKFYEQMVSEGIEVLLDDKPQRSGVKFKDADLIGLPIQVIVGTQSVKKGKVEIRLRESGQEFRVPPEDVLPKIKSLIQAAR